MKLLPKKVNTLLIIFGFVLGVIILVQLFMPSLIEDKEGFREGATTQQASSQSSIQSRELSSARENCKSADTIDKWVKNSVDLGLMDKHFNTTKGELTNDFSTYISTAKNAKKGMDTVDISGRAGTACRTYATALFQSNVKSQSASGAKTSTATSGAKTSTATSSAGSTTSKSGSSSSSDSEVTNEDILKAIQELKEQN